MTYLMWINIYWMELTLISSYTSVIPSFMLMSDAAGKEYKIIIEKAIFKAMMVNVGSEIVTAHSKSMEKGMNRILFWQSIVKSTTIPQGKRNINIDSLFKGNLPDKIVIGFLSAERYNGNYKLNPFLLHHYDVNSLFLLVDDISIPHCPMEMNFGKGQFVSPLHNLLSLHPNIIIDAKSFGKGYTLFCIWSQHESKYRRALIGKEWYHMIRRSTG